MGNPRFPILRWRERNEVEREEGGKEKVHERRDGKKKTGEEERYGRREEMKEKERGKMNKNYHYV